MKEGTSGISVDYTLALLARLDVWLQREVIRFRLTLPEQQDEEYRGLYISDQEVDGLLKSQMPSHSSNQPVKLSEETQRSAGSNFCRHRFSHHFSERTGPGSPPGTAL